MVTLKKEALFGVLEERLYCHNVFSASKWKLKQKQGTRHLVFITSLYLHLRGHLIYFIKYQNIPTFKTVTYDFKEILVRSDRGTRFEIRSCCSK